MARGRPKGSKNYKTESIQPITTKSEGVSNMAPKTEKKVADVKQAPDELGRMKNACPWCNCDNEDEEKAELHKKVTIDYEVANTGHKWQCLNCGKSWNKADLNKPWTIELERGPQWVREHRIRQLGGIA